MISILVYILVLLIVFGIILYVLRSVAIDEPFKTAAILIVCLIFVLLLLAVIGIIPGLGLRPLASLDLALPVAIG